MRHSTTHFAAFALVVLVGCSDEPPQSRLLPQDPASQAGDPVSEQRRRRMDIQAKVAASDGTGTVREVDLSVRALARYVILPDCLKALQAAPGGAVFSSCDAALVQSDGTSESAPVFAEPETFSSTGANTTSAQKQAKCTAAVCRMHLALCSAQRLAELSSAVAPTTFENVVIANTALDKFLGAKVSMSTSTVPLDITVPPQDEESAIAFGEESFHYAAWVATIAGENLRFSMGRIPSGSCDAPTLQTLTIGSFSYGESLASTLTEATLLGDEVVRDAVRHHTSIADAEYSRSPDIGVASKLSWIDPYMSRSRAVHLLTGGGLGDGLWDGQNKDQAFTSGMCPVDELTDSAKKAKDLIQLSGLHPKLVSNLTYAFESLFDNGGYVNGVRDPSISERLAERLGDPSLGEMGGAEFLKNRGLTSADFVAARQYMAEEQRAFVRDPTRVLPALPIASAVDPSGKIVPQSTKAPIYAATAVNPTPPPPAAYRVMARIAKALPRAQDISDGTPSATTDVLAPSASYARKGLAQLIDYSSSVASDLVPLGPNPSNGPSPLFDGLATLSGGLSSWIAGRLGRCPAVC
jgi:hypothetical protein